MPVPAAGAAASRRAKFSIAGAAAPVDSQAVAVLVAGVKDVAGRPRPQPRPPSTAPVTAEAAPPGAAAATAPPNATAGGEAATAPVNSADEALVRLLRAATDVLLTLHKAGIQDPGSGRARQVGGLDVEHVAAVAAAAQDAGLADESAALQALVAELPW